MAGGLVQEVQAQMGTLENLALLLGLQGQFRGVQIRPGAHAAAAAAFLTGGLS